MLDYNVKDITVIIHKGRRGRLRAYVWQEGVAGSDLLTHAFTDIEAAKQEASVRIEKELGRRVNIHWRIEGDEAAPKKKGEGREGQARLFGSEVARHA